MSVKKKEKHKNTLNSNIGLCMEQSFLFRRDDRLSLISYQRNNRIFLSLLSPTPVHIREANVSNEFSGGFMSFLYSQKTLSSVTPRGRATLEAEIAGLGK
jgi:hypothetical protein